jgi:uncharacterized protein (TIGR02996 family)
MPTFPANLALEAAIVAHADEDTPRLAYADWLDENGDPDRAAFIRVQCRLADTRSSHPERIDLLEQQDELLARLKHRQLGAGLSKVKPFYFSETGVGDLDGPFERGFPYFIDYQTYGRRLKENQSAGMIAELTRLVQTTTIRGFHPYELPLSWLVKLLTAPVTAQLTGLSLTPHSAENGPEARPAFHRTIATGPALARIRNLGLYGTLHEGSIAALAQSATLPAVRRLTIQEIRASAATARNLARAPWFRRVRHLRTDLPEEASAAPIVTELGEFPELHTLDLQGLAPDAVKTLAASKFPALESLLYGGPLGPQAARTLGSARFPRLVAFEAHSAWNDKLNDDAVPELLKAEWFERLRALDLEYNRISDKGVRALVAHPVMKTLRVLKLGGNRFSKSGLTALAKRGALPPLTTLVIGSSTDTFARRNSRATDLAKFLSTLQIPHLRHLDLSGWPLGNAGAKALAANPAFAQLTRLSVQACFIGDPGAKALFASPHLRNLVELDIHANSIKNGADALADAAVMPRLGTCRLWSNKIPEATVKKLKRKRQGLII